MILSASNLRIKTGMGSFLAEKSEKGLYIAILIFKQHGWLVICSSVRK